MKISEETLLILMDLADDYRKKINRLLELELVDTVETAKSLSKSIEDFLIILRLKDLMSKKEVR